MENGLFKIGYLVVREPHHGCRFLPINGNKSEIENPTAQLSVKLRVCDGLESGNLA